MKSNCSSDTTFAVLSCAVILKFNSSCPCVPHVTHSYTDLCLSVHVGLTNKILLAVRTWTCGYWSASVHAHRPLILAKTEDLECR